MKTKIFAVAALAVSLSAGAVSAATYDFKAAAEPGGGTGESIYSEFNTSSLFAGPNLKITASASDDNDAEQFVYFDAGNAGMGVCKDPKSASAVNQTQSGGTNQCNPGSDDGLTTTFETLTFKATVSDMIIESIWINSNHDGKMPLTTEWMINGTTYGAAQMVSDSVSGTGDVKIDLGFKLSLGDSFTLHGVTGPNSYVSAMAVSSVPVPASLLLLLGGLGAFGTMRARRKS
ncbi:VPLPA-CTERM sorting domain-containing protein [Tropicimonas sp. S265A]|uniref:VPLPA-CTERM sorting domain-containing protein n=1 Tax=Tropicimonas sp. S265A TaxID=3415134 RepID=UPI003C7A0D78